MICLNKNFENVWSGHTVVYNKETLSSSIFRRVLKLINWIIDKKYDVKIFISFKDVILKDNRVSKPSINEKMREQHHKNEEQKREYGINYYRNLSEREKMKKNME